MDSDHGFQDRLDELRQNLQIIEDIRAGRLLPAGDAEPTGSRLRILDAVERQADEGQQRALRLRLIRGGKSD